MLEAAGLLAAEPGAVAAFIREHATVLDRAQVILLRDCTPYDVNLLFVQSNFPQILRLTMFFDKNMYQTAEPCRFELNGSSPLDCDIPWIEK